MIVLWTDALIFMLIFILAGLAFYLRSKDHIQRPLKKISHSKIGMVSLVVLLFFILIGLLDSIHFKPVTDKSNEIMSLLDYWATPLREHGEKTYSAPFATHLYSKEMTTLEDGSTVWGYPRLQFGGTHLSDPDIQHIPDILQKLFYAFVQGISLISIIFILGVWLNKQNNSYMDIKTMKVVLATVVFIFLISYVLIYLSRFYHVLGTDKVGEDVFIRQLKVFVPAL